MIPVTIFFPRKPAVRETMVTRPLVGEDIIVEGSTYTVIKVTHVTGENPRLEVFVE